MKRIAIIVFAACAPALAQIQEPAPIDPDATRYREQGTVTFTEPPERLVSEVDPLRLLDDLRVVYQTSPLAERLTVSLLSPIGARAETIDLFLLDRRAALVMGPLVVEAVREGDGSVIVRAAHERDSERIVERTIDAPTPVAALRRLLPATPVPQLDLAGEPPQDADAAPASGPQRLTAWAPDVAWERGLLLPDETPRAAAVVGASPDGVSVEVLIDSESGRLRRVAIDRPSRARRLDIEIAPLDPASAPPPLASDGRRVVSELSALEPLAPKRPLPERLDLLVFDVEASPVRLPGDSAAPLLVVIFHEPEGAEAARRLVGGAELAVKSGEVELALRRVAVLEREDRPDLDALAQQWGGGILWSADASSARRLFDGRAAAALLIYDEDGFLRAALTPRDAADAETIAKRIAQALETPAD